MLRGGDLCVYVCNMYVFSANEDCILMKQLDYCQTTYIYFFVPCVNACYGVNRKRNCHMTSTEAQNKAEKIENVFVRAYSIFL